MACSSTIFISDANPFGWTIGDCDPRPAICEIEEGCYCQPMNLTDAFPIQIEYDGAGTPELRFYDNDTGGLIGTKAMTSRGVGYTLYDGVIYDVYFDASFLADDLLIRLEIWDSEQLAVSECILVKESHECTTLIKYTDSGNIAGMEYRYGIENQIRIRSHFWQTSELQNANVYEQSNGTLRVLKKMVRYGAIFNTDDMPMYMHEKLSLIFSHSGIKIGGIYYYSDDNYNFDIPEGVDFSKGSILLKEKDTLIENSL